MLLAYFTFDLGFYWFHRAAHHPRLYKHLHKQHHQFKVTNVGATAWNDAGESFGIMIISDLTALLFKFDLFTWLVWILWSNILDFQVHCGYLFPWNPLNLIIWPPVHDYHHWQNRGNFATSHWDFVFGTAGNFLAWRRRQDERRAKGLEEEPERRTDDDDEVAAKEQ
ncbi:hypothetical protein DFJ74DRAFT_670731 [Hyaloraphidium curvatum]|nr:hypothetical protein DFJ74DRAFT_670731 [Hyaloraphidium curvatum]